MKYIGLLLLGVWLIVDGGLELLNMQFPHDNKVLSAIAIASGAVLLFNSIKSGLNDLGLLVLSLWLILGNSLSVFKFSFPYSELVLVVVGIFAGLLLIIRK